MIEQIQKPTKRKKTNYVSPIIAVTLLLFLVGLLTHFLYQSTKFTNALKEQEAIRVELQKDADIAAIQEVIKGKSFVKRIEFISKEKGWENMKSGMNHDPATLLDENPLPNLFVIHIKAEMNTPVQLQRYKDELQQIDGVESVDYKQADIKIVDKLIDQFMLVGCILIGIFFFIALYIISHTIRLAIFSQRFIIRSMQLVGATGWFIIRPFIMKSFFNGLVSGVLAAGMITGIYFGIEYLLPSWNIFNPIIYFIISMLAIILLGVGITALCSWLMVRRYLGMKLDELY